MPASVSPLLLDLPLDDAVELIQAELAKRDLAEFVQSGWVLHHPKRRLVWQWHMGAICEHLEAVTRGQILRLLINIPPGLCKSLLTSVYWPAWEWATKPSRQHLVCSGNPTVVIRDAVRSRQVIESTWYQQAFVNDAWTLTKGQTAKKHFTNTEHGHRISISTMQAVTGARGDVIILDDPLDARKAVEGRQELDEHTRWYDDALSDRLNADDGAIVVIMQRLHERDLSGHLLEKGGFEHLCLPATYDPERKCQTLIGFADPRTAEGELLAPDVLGQARLDELKKDKGITTYITQYEQNPTSPTGTVFKQEWVKWYDELPPLDEFELIVGSWDSTYKKSRGTDRCCGQVWGKLGVDYYLFPRMWYGRMGLPEHIRGVLEMAATYPEIDAILIELTGNGHGVVEAVRDRISSVLGIDIPRESKLSRAHAVTPLWEGGNVLLPNPNLVGGADWVVRLYLKELLAFPLGKSDDQVDTTTQGLLYLKSKAEPFIFAG